MLTKRFVRDGSRKIVGSVTTGYSDTSSVVRDDRNEITGKTNERFGATRDSHDNLVSTNSSDSGLLIRKK